MSKIFIFHNGSLDNDGRVLRSIDILSAIYDEVEVVCRKGSVINNLKVTQINNWFCSLPLIGNFIWSFVTVIKFYGKAKNIYFHDFLTLILAFLFNFDRGIEKRFYDAHELLLADELGYSEYKKYWQFFEEKVVAKVDFLIAANEHRIEKMKEYYSYNRAAIVINNYYEGYPLNNETKKVIRNSKPIFVYQGSLAKDRCIDKFIHFLSYLPIDFELLVIGSGPELESLEKITVDLGLTDKVSFLGHLPKAEMYKVIKGCDIGIITYQMKGLNTIFCAPNKIYEYAAFGLPMISSPQPTLKSTLTENRIGCSLLVDDWESNEWTDSITLLTRLINDYEEYTNNTYDFSSVNSWHNAKAGIIERLRELSL